MKITEVRITPVDFGNLKAYATITFDKVFVVTGLKVIEGVNGEFVAMPNKQAKDGEWKDIAFPIDKAFRREIQDAVLAKYMGTETAETKKEEPTPDAPAEPDTDDDLSEEFPF